MFPAIVNRETASLPVLTNLDFAFSWPYDWEIP